MNRDVVVMDLDGTLVCCNSFIEYVKWMAPKHPCMWIIALARKLRLISHAEAKRRIMAVNVSPVDLNRFVDELLKYVRKDLLDAFRNKEILLATAAPAKYAVLLAQRIGIKHVCASNSGEPENKGLVKCACVKEFLAATGLSLSVVVTDHEDDLPILRYNQSGENILVSPKASTLKLLDECGICYSLFF